MILTSAEIDAHQIVSNPVAAGKRRTSYDATVGEIISDGDVVNGQRFKLPSRGIVWVVSQEMFTLPDNITGIATLKTTWTHKGILAINVGVIDPEWSGPLAAAIVNFSNTDFVICKGDTFFRVVFHEHKSTSGAVVANEMASYIEFITECSTLTKDSFLNISEISDEVSRKIFGSSNWASRITLWGLIIAGLAIFFPVAYGVCTDYISHKNEISVLKNEMRDVKETQDAMKGKMDALARPVQR